MPDLKEKGDVSDFLRRRWESRSISRSWPARRRNGPPRLPESNPSQSPRRIKSHASILKRIAATAELFKTPAGDGYATVKVNGRAEHHPVESRAIELWLTYEFMQQVDRAPSGESLSQIVSTIKARGAILAGRDPGWDSRCT